MSPQTKQRIKIWCRRLALRWLRKLVDVADDRLHTAEVKLRKEIAEGKASSQQDSPVVAPLNRDTPRPATGEDFQQWEARRSGFAPVSKKKAVRRQRLTAADFDRRFA